MSGGNAGHFDLLANARFTAGRNNRVDQLLKHNANRANGVVVAGYRIINHFRIGVGGNTAYVGFTGGTGGLSSSQKILTWTYTTQAVSPAFSPAPGTYTSQQSISLTSATPDAVIYYTADGSKPTAAKTRYTGPIQVAQSETINAVAISKTYGTMGAAIALMVWLYWTSFAMLLGAELNCQLAKESAKGKIPQDEDPSGLTHLDIAA